MMSFYSLCFAFKLDSISFEERRLWGIRNLYARHFLCGSEHRIVLCSCLPSLQTKKLQWLHRGRPLIKFYYVMQKQQDFIKLDLFHLKDGVLRRKTQFWISCIQRKYSKTRKALEHCFLLRNNTVVWRLFRLFIFSLCIDDTGSSTKKYLTKN